MYDYGLSVMEQYSCQVERSYRGRGALICQTNQGLYLLRPFSGSEKRLNRQQELLKLLYEECGMKVDAAVCNQEESYLSRDEEGKNYVLYHWYEGRECETASLEDTRRSMETLAHLHKMMVMPVYQDYISEPLDLEYQRHNRELKKIRRFIRQKKVSNSFEREYLDSVEEFLEWGEAAQEKMVSSQYSKLREQAIQKGCICHGEFNQHHVLLTPQSVAVTGFEKWKYDCYVGDLYCFMRKILEKSNWDPKTGMGLLEAYQGVRPLSDWEYENLKLRFLYPEKYWKLANYYYAHNKAWVSEKNVDKLRTLIRQKKDWRNFTQICFNAKD